MSPRFTPFFSFGSLLAVAILSVVLLSAGCGSRPQTPEDVWHRFAELNAKGDVRGIWALYHPEGQEQQRTAIEGLKDMIRKNPDPMNFKNLVEKQFKVHSKEEFYRLTVVELLERENQGLEHLMEGAEIEEIVGDPEDPDNVKAIYWRSFWGDGWMMVVKRMEDGWGLVKQTRMAPKRAGSKRTGPRSG